MVDEFDTRNPYVDKEGNPILKPSLVVFVDIQGYADLVREAENSGRSQELLIRLHHTLKEATRNLNLENQTHREFNALSNDLPKKDLYKLRTFTDNIVIGYPLHPFEGWEHGEWELNSVIYALSFFQTEMTNAGFFVRGAISIGDLYVDETVVYGQGLIEAHTGENQLARDPRIVFTKSAREVVLQQITRYGEHTPFVSRIYRDSDGQLFLNYLDYRILIAENDIGPDYEALQKHKAITETKLTRYQDQPHIWTKYMWTANYHNYFCRRHNHYFGEAYRIDIARYQMQPTLIRDEKREA